MRGLRAVALGFALLIAVGSAAKLAAQGAPASVTVRTFMLQRLTQQQAADLLSPYTSSALGEGVFTAGTGVRGVTVRGTRETLARVDSLLRANDRPAGTVRLRFRLIAAVDSTLPVDPAIADVDAALRGLFSYKGYRFMGEGALVAKEGFEGFNLTLNVSGMERYVVAGSVRELDLEGANPTAQIHLSLRRPSQEAGSSLLSTEVPAVLGRTVVVGSSGRVQVPGTMILAVRPERN